MPFDDGHTEISLNRHLLIQRLRSGKPHLREWYFGSCGTCAFQSMVEVFENNKLDKWLDALGISITQFQTVFSSGAYFPIKDKDVTPEMVADKLELVTYVKSE